MVSWLVRWRRFWCGARGHEGLLSIEDGWIALKCSCGWKSPGIAIPGKVTVLADRRKVS